ncbi:hypothetical protein [Nonomuraea sp. NPDC049028]|uniref:hypothetical protein n=1 Tax=Nonomuraea sp. NPDC049028 TaxID=3364348 RepID=UPI003715C171
MSKTTPEAEPARGSWLWRGVAIIAVVVLAASLAAGLVWFFADPLRLPKDVLETLDQRASVVAMFTGMALGVAGLVVAMMALRAPTRADHTPPAATATPDAGQQAPQVAAEGERSIAIGSGSGSGNSSIVSTGDGARNVQMRADASEQGRVCQTGGDQTIREGGDHRRTYGGDHIEFHHSTFHDKVVGKRMITPEPAAPDGDADGRR